MIKIIQVFLFVFFATQLSAQDFTGQWKGSFVDKSSAFTGWSGDSCEYVIEIEVDKSKVTGYSYTYFSDGGKRYYTICELKGTLNKADKYIEVGEIKRTKTNVPANIRNCFQIHHLTYFQRDNEQILEGSWLPAPNQNGDCGFGTTILSRRMLKKNPDYYNNNTVKVATKKTESVAKSNPIENASKIAKTKKTTETPINKVVPNKNEEDAKDQEIKKIVLTPEKTPFPKSSKAEIIEKKIPEILYQKRSNYLLKTIEIDNGSFTVDLYDNGEIDGDSISLFFNDKLLLSNKRLSDKSISLKLNIDETRELNELIMYAENLGTIAPNTALMIINDGDSRYEVRISSDLQKSGVIQFVHKPKIKQ